VGCEFADATGVNFSPSSLFKISVYLYQTTLRHIVEQNNVYNQRSQDVKRHFMLRSNGLFRDSEGFVNKQYLPRQFAVPVRGPPPPSSGDTPPLVEKEVQSKTSRNLENIIIAMSPDGIRNQGLLRWRGPEAI
jgi:hypothetical protein